MAVLPWSTLLKDGGTILIKVPLLLLLLGIGGIILTSLMIKKYFRRNWKKSYNLLVVFLVVFNVFLLDTGGTFYQHKDGREIENGRGVPMTIPLFAPDKGSKVPIINTKGQRPQEMDRLPTNSHTPLLQFGWGQLLYKLENPRTRNRSWIKVIGPEAYPQQPKVPVIMKWTTEVGRNTSISWEAGQTYLKSKIMNCPVSNCIYTDDRSKYLEADAIIFFQMEFHPEYHRLPPKRLPHQRYVFINREAPIQRYVSKVTHNRTFIDNFYNWTATYRLDADIHTPYSMFFKADKPYKVAPKERYMAKKTRGKKYVAWFVSNCKTFSRREEYVKELQKYIPVDVYGKCGPLNCPNEGTHGCHKQLKNYWFYLSFESSLCTDYITEKLLYPMMYGDVIPVVFGAANYTKQIPLHSFINIKDFVSPKALAAFLIKLTEDEERYTAYFDWKEWYRPAYVPNYICQLCSRLHERPLVGQVYTDFTSWWNKDMCDQSWVLRNKANWGNSSIGLQKTPSRTGVH